MLRIIFRIGRYGVANFVFFVLDLAVVFILTSFLGWHYVFSVSFGFITTTAGLFFANRKWTFISTVHPLPGVMYATGVAVVGLVIITAITYIGVEYSDLHYIVARLVAATFAFVWSYIADSLFTFRVPPFS